MIKTLIVMTTYGQIFYSKDTFFDAKPGDTDISLTAGLISAIYNLTAETQQQKITELELEEDRSVFKELADEKLFIITVDKRMDPDDADDLLDDLSTRFVDQYGDMAMDGLILNDFEPTVDEIIEDRLWYNSTNNRLKLIDVVPLFILLFSAIWYPLQLLDGEKRIIDPIELALTEGTASLIIQSSIIGLKLLGPLILLMITARGNIRLLITFTFEFLRRPTRGGYAELLPNWFLIIPVIVLLIFVSVVRWGRGLAFALSVQPLTRTVESTVVGPSGEFLLFNLVYLFLIFYFLTWFTIFPAIVGLMIGEFDWRWIKSSSIIIGLSLILFIPTQIIGGEIFHEFAGFNPNNPIFATEADSLQFLFSITLPINLFVFLFVFYLGVGLSQLVRKNKERYPIALGAGVFLNFAIQDFIFFVIFESGWIFPQIY